MNCYCSKKHYSFADWEKSHWLKENLIVPWVLLKQELKDNYSITKWVCRECQQEQKEKYLEKCFYFSIDTTNSQSTKKANNENAKLEITKNLLTLNTDKNTKPKKSSQCLFWKRLTEEINIYLLFGGGEIENNWDDYWTSRNEEISLLKVSKTTAYKKISKLKDNITNKVNGEHKFIGKTKKKKVIEQLNLWLSEYSKSRKQVP